MPDIIKAIKDFVYPDNLKWADTISKIYRVEDRLDELYEEAGELKAEKKKLEKELSRMKA